MNIFRLLESSRSSPARRRTTTTPPSVTLSSSPTARFTDDVTSDDLLDTLDPSALVRALAEQGVEGARALVREEANRTGSSESVSSACASCCAGRPVVGWNGSPAKYRPPGRGVGRRRRKSDGEVAREIAALEQRLEDRPFRRLVPPAVPRPPRTTWRSALSLSPLASWNRPAPPPGSSPAAGGVRPIHRLATWALLPPAGPGPGRSPGRRCRSPSAARTAERSARPRLGNALARFSAAERHELSETVAQSLQDRERTLRREADEKRRPPRPSAGGSRRSGPRRSDVPSRRPRTGCARARKARLQRELKERGFVAEHGGELVVTYGLVERFARLLLEEESHRLPGDVRLSLKGGGVDRGLRESPVTTAG